MSNNRVNGRLHNPLTHRVTVLLTPMLLTPIFRTILSVATVVAILLNLSACNLDKANATKQSTDNNNAAPTETIRIAAAANLAEVLPDIIKGYQSENNLPASHIEVSYASSGKLYSQIQAGAPYDLFLSANQDFPKKWVTERPASAPDSLPFTYTQGQLSVYSATKSMAQLNPARLTTLLTTQADSKVTIASPVLAPYGASAQAYLQSQNIYETLERQKRIIQAENIGQAFQYAHTGNVDYGFVAQSQVVAIHAAPDQFYLLPPDTYPAILQDGILLSNAVTAADFSDYLRSATAQAYFAKAGYLALKP